MTVPDANIKPSVASADRWKEYVAQKAWEKAQKKLAQKEKDEVFSQYQDNPVKFGTEVLGEYYTDDMKTITESVRDNPVTIARSANGVGKTFSAARIAIWFFLTYPDSKVYMTAAPPMSNLKRILWGEMMSVVRTHGRFFKEHKITTTMVERHSTSFIAAVAIPTSGSAEERESKFSGKHASHMLFIVDEGDAVPDEVYKGIESCMSGGMTRLLIMFNPRAQVGPVYTKEKNKQANVVHLSAFNHPNVITGKNIVDGAVDRETTGRRINQWTREMHENERKTAETFEVPDFMVGYVAKQLSGKPYPPIKAGRRVITQPEFSYMVMGQYPSKGETQLISQEWIDNARSRWDAYTAKHGNIPPKHTEVVMGMDMAEYGKDSNIACLRYGGYIAPLITWNGVDPNNSAIRGLDVYRLKGVSLAMVDGTGVGSSVAPTMARMGRDEGVRAISVKVAGKPTKSIQSELGEFKILRDQLWWAVREWLRTDEGAMLPPDGALIEELKTPSYEIKNGKIMVTKKKELRKILRRSPDRADALCLAFAPFGRIKFIQLEQK